MKLTMSGLMAIVIAAALPAATYAGTRDPGVNHWQHTQRQCIEQGWRSGELTGGEARHLGREARDIRQEERQYKFDGVLTWDERIDLQQNLNAASQLIYNETHDADRRGFNTGFSR
jgi:hypothetical protein